LTDIFDARERTRLGFGETNWWRSFAALRSDWIFHSARSPERAPPGNGAPFILRREMGGGQDFTGLVAVVQLHPRAVFISREVR